MLFKLRQQLPRHKRTTTNRTPDLYSRKFIINYLRQRRLRKTSGALRASLGLARWLVDVSNVAKYRGAFRASCYLTGRARGTSQRFTVTRMRIKHIAATARLFGVRKSSW
jgi:ribosomal protein S14